MTVLQRGAPLVSTASDESDDAAESNYDDLPREMRYAQAKFQK